jgi:hypothetical protein
MMERGLNSRRGGEMRRVREETREKKRMDLENISQRFSQR